MDNPFVGERVFMNLLVSALIISVAIAFFTLLPWFISSLRNYSRVLQISGALVLFGVCFFDLIPEMMELGGTTSLLIMLVSWAAFSVVHRLQHQGHADQGEHEHGGTYLLAAMTLHCFAGGLFLVSSYEISERLATHVFWGLLVHKGFEAISVSSVLLEKIHTKKQLYISTFTYAFSFPLGVVVASLAHSAFQGKVAPATVEQIGMVISSVAVGSLLGCLIQDYAVPVVRGMLRNTALRAN